ncbi:hypothetical protein GWI33_006656 [Rhynchophorus ferrugineus]|uniref:Uncharacterized protein n=1 Tax=Rhynchophorus ferrugineus TaxID=354439 RepID=A0A834IKS2_RHYFE|nr:hypothetical protein GWI33_006656 [Rhynchophorus ferrugineus]
MVMHWESSQRPLYVKTIWRDGQHHVILDKNKEHPLELTSSFRKQKSAIKSQSNRRTSKSATVKMSSAKMLLSNVGRFKSVDHQWKPTHDPDLMVKPLSGRQTVTCQEMVVNTMKTSRTSRLLKTESGGISSKSMYIDSSRALDNPLSDKVLVWLDLAVQSGNLSKKLNPMQGNHTPEPVKMYVHASSPTNTCTPRETVDSSILKQQPEYAASGEVIVFSKQEKDTVEDDFYHILTPRIKDQNICNGIMESKKRGASPTKRQLHIFMPNLPKKTSDCDSSILSSIMSSSIVL